MKKILYILLLLNVSLFAQNWSFYGGSGYSSGWGITFVNDTTRLPSTDYSSSYQRVYSLKNNSFTASGTGGTYAGFWEIWNYKGNTYYSTSSGTMFIDTIAYSAASSIQIASRAGQMQDAICVNDTLYYLQYSYLLRSLDGGRTIKDTMFTAPNGEFLSEMSIQNDSIFVITNKSYYYGINIPSALDSGYVYKITKSKIVTSLGSLLSTSGLTYAKGILKIQNSLFAFVDANDSTYRGLYLFNGSSWNKVYSDTGYKHADAINFTSDNNNTLFLSYGISTSDSNKNRVYSYNINTKIENKLPPIIVPSSYYYCAKVYYNIYEGILYGLTSFVYTKDNISNGVAFYPNSSPNYQTIALPSLSIYQPYYGSLFNVGDSVSIVINSLMQDTQIVYINYSGTYDSLGVFVGDSTKFVVDSISANAQFKLVDKNTGVTVYSNSFKVYPAKYISIDTVYYDPANVNIKAIHNGLTDIKAYYSADSLTWQYLGESTIVDTLKTDTLSYLRLVGMNTANSYYKLVEAIDTAVYGFKLTKITDFGLIANPQICITFAFNDSVTSGYPGGNDIKDVGCGWVNTITKYYEKVNTVIDTDGTVIVTSSSVAYPFPYTGMPALNHNDMFQVVTSSTPFVYAGRAYWEVTTPTQWYPNYTLWMKDLIHNVSYPVLDIGSGGVGVGIIAVWSSLEAKVFPNDVGIFRSSDGLGAFSTKLLPYPVSNTPVSSAYHLIANAYNYSNRYQILQPRF